MTCIIGAVYEGNVYIGGDSMGSNGYMHTIRSDIKVFKLKNNPDFLVGYCGSFRVGHLIQHSTSLVPDKYEKRNKVLKLIDRILPTKPKLKLNEINVNHEFMVNSFVSNLQKLMAKGGCECIECGEKSMPGSILVGYKDKLFCIESDYQVGIPNAPFDAIGSGEAVAKGAMFVLYGSEGHQIENKIVMALGASSEFTAGVGPPYFVISSKYTHIKEFDSYEDPG